MFQNASRKYKGYVPPTHTLTTQYPPPPTRMYITMTTLPTQSPSKGEAKKSIATLAVTQFDIPGDTKYPLNSFMGKPVNRQEAGMDHATNACILVIVSIRNCMYCIHTVWHMYGC